MLIPDPLELQSASTLDWRVILGCCVISVITAGVFAYYARKWINRWCQGDRTQLFDVRFGGMLATLLASFVTGMLAANLYKLELHTNEMLQRFQSVKSSEVTSIKVYAIGEMGCFEDALNGSAPLLWEMVRQDDIQSFIGLVNCYPIEKATANGRVWGIYFCQITTPCDKVYLYIKPDPGSHTAMLCPFLVEHPDFAPFRYANKQVYVQLSVYEELVVQIGKQWHAQHMD